MKLNFCTYNILLNLTTQTAYNRVRIWGMWTPVMAAKKRDERFSEKWGDC